MRLHSFTVSGFRSLQFVQDIPVRSPTVLTGHNDGGKSATLAALGFLLGSYSLTDEDRTFAPPAPQDDPDNEPRSPGQRHETTWVEGCFIPSASEQRLLQLPGSVRIRRISSVGSVTDLQLFRQAPEDARLWNLEKLTVAKLLELTEEFSITPTDRRKPSLVATLKSYVAEAPHIDTWVSVPSDLTNRLPQFLSFGGKVPDANETVRAALNSRYQLHLKDESLQGKVSELERALSEKLRGDASDLCEHIKSRCTDLLDVAVDPEVSFKSGLGRTHLRLARAEGEPVGLDGSGAGRARRVALAVWEWTSDILTTASAPADDAADTELEPTREVIVAYDEPDTHLDYAHQRRVMDLIRSQCGEAHIQVMIATHSLNLIDGVDIGDVVHLRLVNDRTVIERLESEAHENLSLHLNEIAAALGVRNSVLLYERCFVGVEGPTEQQAFPVLFRIAQGLPLQSAGISLWACNGNEGALHFARFLKVHDRAVALAVDSDSRTRARSLFTDDKLRAHGIDPDSQVFFLGAPNEVEELFSDDQWAAAANHLWPRNDGVKWDASDFTALRSAGKFSSQVEQLVKVASDTGPSGKPDALFGLATTLERPEEIPQQLRELFTDLVALAQG